MKLLSTVSNTACGILESGGQTIQGAFHLTNVMVDVAASEVEAARFAQEINQAKELGLTQHQLNQMRHKMYPNRYPTVPKK